MANDILMPSELPAREDPAATEVVPSDNGTSVAAVTWADGVAAGRPLATQGEAEAGAQATKAMTPLTTKQAIDAQVPAKISTAIDALFLGTASQAAVEDFATAEQGTLADSAVQPDREITSGSGLEGGGTLAANREIALNSASIASLALADSALQAVDLEPYTPTAGLGDLALLDTVNNANWSGADLAIENGGTGASSAPAARTNLGLGTAATTDATAYATAAQGTTADTAVQPGDLGDLALKDQIAVPADISATGTPSATTVLFGDGAWKELTGGGDMLTATYDPDGVAANVFDLANHDLMTLPVVA